MPSIAAIALAVVALTGSAATPRTSITTGALKMSHAAGAFDVKVTPVAAAAGEEPSVGRMTIDKQYHGDLEATGKGQMLTGMSAVEGSGVYVAVERVSGTLGGRKGTFMLHHVGTMERGAPNLSIRVVPDSGTDELVGLKGTMTIEVKEGGKHFYAFEYSLPDKP